MPQNLFTLFATKHDLHQTPMHAQIMRDIHWQVYGKPGNQVFVRRIGPVAFAKAQHFDTFDPNFLWFVQKKERVLLFQLEPAVALQYGKKKLTYLPGHHAVWDTTLARYGIKKQCTPLAHSKTMLIDLRLSEAQLLSQMKQKMRYNIGLTQRKGLLKLSRISFAKCTPAVLQELFDLQKKWRRSRPHALSFPEDFLHHFVRNFTVHGHVYTAHLGNILAAALYVPVWEKMATYYCACALPEGFASHAPTALTWYAMLQSKAEGCQIFDFGGVYDERYPKTYKGWKGFTVFKEGFSPLPVVFPEPRVLSLFH